ncbi:MAG: inositol monophosphatase [Candidatus Aminicenantes bacterium]|nr:inositol monophosphatase [Candidatus Aminicenantes bacterium]
MERQAIGLAEAREAVREAGRLLRENLDGRGEVSFKGAVDLVTAFDRKAQELVDRRLAAAFPEHGFLSEENLDRRGTSGCRWVLDPLDGTTNFAHTLPIFSVSLALERQGEILLGVVYDPMRDEMFWAAAGEGAFLNGRPVRVSPVDRLDRSLLATGFPYDIRESRLNNLDHFTNFAVRAQAVRRCGSAALDLCYVACGRFDGFWELKLKPWDVAAGSLIIREAGGRVTDFDSGDFDIFHPELAASNGLIHEEMLRVLNLGRTRRTAGEDGR